MGGGLGGEKRGGMGGGGRGGGGRGGGMEGGMGGGGGSIRVVIPGHDEEDFCLCGTKGIRRDCGIDRKGMVEGVGLSFTSEKYKKLVTEKLRIGRRMVEEEGEEGWEEGWEDGWRRDFFKKGGGERVFLMSFNRWFCRLDYDEKNLERFLKRNLLEDGEGDIKIKRFCT